MTRNALFATRSHDSGSQKETVQRSGHLSGSAAALLLSRYLWSASWGPIMGGPEGALGLGSHEATLGWGSTEND